MVVMGVLIALAATAMGLWALVLQVRANPTAGIPVLTGRVLVDPPRARGLRAGAAAVTVMACSLVAAEVGMAALWLLPAPLLLPVLAALCYNQWLARGSARGTG